MSLYLKIFLWFWLSIALVVAVVSFINWSTQPENLGRQWQTFIAETVQQNAQTAAQIYRAEGESGLNEYLTRLQTGERVNGVGFFDDEGGRVGGNLERAPENLFGKALQSDATEFSVAPNETFAAGKIQLKTGERFVYVAHLRRPPQTAFPDLRTRILQILAIILTAGLGCYGLARYLTSPIGKLRRAAQKLAGGDLQTRVMPEIGSRRDELARLAGDFDEMAERIENLLVSQKRLTQDVSHELRSPLARLNVALELAKQKTDAENTLMLDRIERESNNLNEMISRLLVLSKLESGAADIEKSTIDLSKLIEQTVSDADFEARAKNKSVAIIKNQSCVVVGNENLLRSAFENVLRNAIRYTKEETTVEVMLKNENGNVSLTVKDRGDGVPEAELAKLFRPFYRVGEDRNRRTGGIGLGLAIAERAVSAHGGSIEASNHADGFLIEIILPRTND